MTSLNTAGSKALPAVVNLRKQSSLNTSGLRSYHTPKLNNSGSNDDAKSSENDQVLTPNHNNDKESNPKYSRTIYRNRRGEEIVFRPCYPPRGYVFLPSGDPFITRRCRELATHVQAVYRSGNRKRPPSQVGLHVPWAILAQAEFDFEDRIKQEKEKL
ncbi:hypothetical protein F5884DRAFT_748491 [Xylogone sp. PMI_703]|nr:hypothetical protein F5884DRAFT_748491 [Xylogone sp. PMI_703]